MPPTLRDFHDDEYDAVVRLWRAAGLTVKPSDTLPELRKLIDRNPGLFLVAEEDGTVCGTVLGAWMGGAPGSITSPCFRTGRAAGSDGC